MATAKNKEMMDHIANTKAQGTNSAIQIGVLLLISMLISILIAMVFGRRIAKNIQQTVTEME